MYDRCGNGDSSSSKAIDTVELALCRAQEHIYIDVENASGRKQATEHTGKAGAASVHIKTSDE